MKDYHDLLLSYCAFPFNKKIHSLATAELERITGFLSNNTSKAKQTTLMGSGMAQTELICSYSRAITQWLVKTFPGSVELEGCEASNDDIINVFHLLLPAVEFEVSTQRTLTLGSRIKLASGYQKPGDQLAWLMQVFDENQLDNHVKDQLFHQLKIFSRWRLDYQGFNKTLLRLPVQKIWYQDNFIKPENSLRILQQKTGSPLPLSAGNKKFLLDLMRASLAFSYRETDPLTFADEDEIELFDLGRGLRIALVGMEKRKRLSLESYIGYMAFKNGLPIAYGGGWLWGQRCKIGINIYPPFRRGESAWLFCQVLRIYYQYFGCRHFIVKPYQYGKGNPEGLKSGAFWFYYKLGFRPREHTIQQEAAREWTKTRANKKYRTGLNTLQRFTASNMEWKTSEQSFPRFDASVLSRVISNSINKNYGRSRKKAIAASLDKMRKRLPLENLRRQILFQDRFIENWSLLTGLIDDIAQWTPGQKKKLLQLVQLKQAGKERDFIIQLQKHRRLWKSLQDIMETEAGGN